MKFYSFRLAEGILMRWFGEMDYCRILFFSAAMMQQKEKELQNVFHNSLISLVGHEGIEPSTY